MQHPRTPDPIFADERLAPLYDAFEGDRADLLPYLAIVHELGARTLIDIGCGTGEFALLAAAEGYAVQGIDPARASLNVAKAKPGSALVRWHEGTVETAPASRSDLAVMTGNVAQVFLEDEVWLRTLAAIRERLRDGGHLVFEARRPSARAWESWAEPHEESRAFPSLGLVRHCRELLEVDLPLVRFRHSYAFPDGSLINSDSTLRFRSEGEHREALNRSGFEVVAVREAPDRPGKEFVFLATAV